MNNANITLHLTGRPFSVDISHKTWEQKQTTGACVIMFLPITVITVTQRQSIALCVLQSGIRSSAEEVEAGGLMDLTNICCVNGFSFKRYIQLLKSSASCSGPHMHNAAGP